jgi:hypothetical protein
LPYRLAGRRVGAVEKPLADVFSTTERAARLAMNVTLKISRENARRFHRRAVLLDGPVASVGAALEHHGYVQIDPINVCLRKPDSMLRG